MLNKSEFKNHLVNDLLPFWNNLYDKEYGGFYDSVDSDNNIMQKAPKLAVLQTRLLWFYSSCYKELKDEKLLNFADLQFDFINKYMLDKNEDSVGNYGGVYWEVYHDGKVKDSHKHTYAQAFALYSVSAYYSVSKNENALNAANKLFNLIENYYKDNYGYPEPKIIDKNVPGLIYTMNTLLHLIEAYTEYYQIVKSDESRKALEYTLNLVINKAYNDNLSRIECFFDEFMNPVEDIVSYGHDIESSWLIYRACEVLGNENILNNLAPKLEKIAQNVISKSFVDEGRNGMYYDCRNGVENKKRSWWVMAEAIVALVHQYNLYKNEKSMFYAENIWNYVKNYFISPYGEWYMNVDESGKHTKNPEGLCGGWKCPYHNGRMCLEMMKALPR